MTDRQRNGFILLLVVGLVIASLIVIAGVPGTGVKAKKTVSIKGAELVSIDCDSAIQMRGNKVILFSSGDLVVEGANSVNVNSGSVVNVQAPQINLNCGSSKSAKDNLKQVDTTPTFDGS